MFSIRSGLQFIVVLCGIALLAGPAWAQDEKSGTSDEKTESEKPFVLRPEHKPFDKFVGTWQVTERHFLDDGSIVEREGSERVEWILGGKVLRRTYRTGSGEGVYNAEGRLNYNSELEQYIDVWSDDADPSGPTIRRGEIDSTRTAVTWYSERLTEDGLAVTHKVTEQFMTDGSRVSTTYVKNGDEWVPRLEVVYKQIILCPSKATMRVLSDM